MTNALAPARTAADLVLRLERAMAARQRYVAAGRPDHVVDHQLLAHVTLLIDLAREADATDDQLSDAIERAAKA